MIFIHFAVLHELLGTQAQQLQQRMYKPDRDKIRLYREQILKQQYADLTIISAPQGKPIAEHYPAFQFNHSHSQQHYALAYSHDVTDLGIDIEDLSRQVNMHKLAHKIFHVDEMQMWQKLDFCRAYWFKVWTIKEAVVKAHGMGLTLELKTLNTQAHPTWDFGRIEHPLLGVFLYQTMQVEQSMLTVAYRQNGMQLQQLKFCSDKNNASLSSH